MSAKAQTLAAPRVEPPVAPTRPQTQGGRAIPVMRQTTATDCATTCVRMALAYHGRHVPAGELSAHVGAGRDGASAWSVLEAARAQGLAGRGLKLDACAVHRLGRGSILHWDQKHFVVLERVRPRGGRRPASITIVDPALGRCQLDEATFRARFSGIALEL